MSRLAVLVACLVIVTGCGAEHVQPTAKPRATSEAPRPSASSLKAPPMPQAAKRKSHNGAVAFTSHYLTVRNFAMRTGQTTELRRLTAPECLMCNTTPTLIEATYLAGGRIDGGLWQRTTKVFLDTGYPGGQEPTDRGFLMTNIHLTPMKIAASDGRTIATYPGSNHDRGLSISIAWRGGHWCVEQILTVGGQAQ
jgi:hypothetical protein